MAILWTLQVYSRRQDYMYKGYFTTRTVFM